MSVMLDATALRVVWLCSHLEKRFIGIYGVTCQGCRARWCTVTPYGR